MRPNVSVFLLASLFAAVATGQTDHIFHLTHVATPQNYQEVATLLRVIAEVPQASPDAARKTLAVRGTPDQVALAEWLVNDLEGNSPGSNPARHEYRPSGANDVVRIFYLQNMETVRDLQQAATVVRSIGEIRRLIIYNAQKVTAVRGTGDQIQLAAWLFHELDRPAHPQPSQADRYRLRGSGDIVRVFFLKQPQTERDFQQFAVHVRSASQISHVFTYGRPRALAVRGTAAQIALAGRLIDAEDR
jgi:hypothetical protein